MRSSGKLNSHIRHNVIGYIALFIALSGTAYAARPLITGADVQDESLTGADVQNNSLKGADVDEATLNGVSPNGAAGGDLTGTYPNPSIAANVVNSGKVSNDSLTGDDISEATLSGVSPGGAAGGDLTGNYPNPSVANGAITPAKLNAGLQFTNALPLWPGGCNLPSVSPGWYAQPSEAGSNIPSVSYGRDAFGVVHLRGLAVNCSAPNTVVFTLPPGFRPAGNVYAPGLDFSTGALIRITVTADHGDVHASKAEPPGFDTVMPSLDGVTFRCGPSGSNGCP